MNAGKLLVLSMISLTIYVTATEKVIGQEAPTPEWTARIRQLAPKEATAQPAEPRKVLLFSLFTGYKHDVIPYVKVVFKVLAERSRAFEIEMSDDIEMLAYDKLREYDAVILNNNCSIGPGRNIFLDVLNAGSDNPDSPYADYSEEMRRKKATELEAGLIKFVQNGAGLMAVHGAIVMQNNSQAFCDMLGGNFDFHPKNQEVMLNPVEPAHPLLKAFAGKPFHHKDEPYVFSSCYAKNNFRPLLVMDTSKLELQEEQRRVLSDVRYVSWIKKHGKGRVFYVSPSHNATSYENKQLLQFYLDGLQYVLGDLNCDDTPMSHN